MQEFFTAIGIIGGIILVGFFSGFGRRDANKSGMGSDTNSTRAINNGLTDCKNGIDASSKRIEAGKENIDSSINRLRDAIAILDSAKKRNDGMEGK